MGGCISGCYACCDNCKRDVNPWQERVTKMGCQTTEIDKGDGYIIRRSNSSAKLSAEEFMTKFAQDKTMLNMLRGACDKFKDRVAMSWRRTVKTTKEDVNGKMMDITHLAEREAMTYGKLWSVVNGFGNGLKKVGIEAGHKIALYEETCAEWLISCYGIWAAGATPVTVYANLGEDALIYALKESEVDTIICNARDVKKLQGYKEKFGVNLKNIIFIGDLEGDVPAGASSYHSVAESGLGDGECKPEIDENTLGLLMYTSGTTGDPKGVMLTQGNCLTAVNGINMRLLEILEDAEDPTYIGYLPLAHILEFCAENIMLLNGFQIGYGHPRTLSDSTTRPHGDLKEYKPTFFAGVPRVFDGLRKVIESKLPPVGELRRTVFDRAFAERKQALKDRMTTPHWNDKVFANTASALGGRCKWIISGGAPLSAKTQEWLTVVFGCFVGQGYGLTETAAATSVQRYWDYQFENTGVPLSCSEVKLRSVDAYKVDDPDGPKGEVLIRGGSVAQGYYKQPEKTAEAFLPDGFFATGDVGQFGPDGTLKIIGRTKALAKNSHGEYIAMEMLESMYVQNDLVLPNGICIVVDSHQPFIVAVALTDESKTMEFCKKAGIENAKWPDVLQDADFKKKSIASLTATAKENGKKPFEFLRDCLFLNEEWTPENGILTAAQKLKRREIDAKYKDQIAAMIEKHAEKTVTN